MEVQVRQELGVTLVSIRGDIDSESVSSFKSQILSLFDQDRNRLILDFDEVEYINSLGIGVIALAIKTAQEKGGGLRFLRVKGPLAELFHIVRFDQMGVPWLDDEEAAIASFPAHVESS